MKKTLLSTAGVLALALGVAGAASAAENSATAYGNQAAFQDILNESLNDNGSDNTLASGNDNDGIDVDAANSGNASFTGNGNDNVVASGNDNDGLDLDVADAGNDSFNGNGSGNKLYSANDNDGLDLDVAAKDVGNDKSHDDDDVIDIDAKLHDVANDKSYNSFDGSQNWTDDHSYNLDNIAVVVNEQSLYGAAAPVRMAAGKGNVATGAVEFGEQTNAMAAGNVTDSINTGAGSVALSVSGIQANGTFHIGNN